MTKILNFQNSTFSQIHFVSVQEATQFYPSGIMKCSPFLRGNGLKILWLIFRLFLRENSHEVVNKIAFNFEGNSSFGMSLKNHVSISSSNFSIFGSHSAHVEPIPTGYFRGSSKGVKKVTTFRSNTQKREKPHKS